MIKEHPIIFTTELIPKILDGTKTQTRRVLKPQPKRINDDFDGTWEWKEKGHYYDDLTLASMLKENNPYGQVGDELWVKETWRILDDASLLDAMVRVEYKADNKIAKFRLGDIAYTEADKDSDAVLKAMETGKWQGSRCMLHRLSRITLEITGIRDERLQKISLNDAIAEGCAIDSESLNRIIPHLPIQKFKELWDSLNTTRKIDITTNLDTVYPYSWRANPWVWCISFKKL